MSTTYQFSLSNKLVALRGNTQRNNVLRKHLSLSGANLVDFFNTKVDLVIIDNECASQEDQNAALSMGIPVVTTSFMLEQIAKPAKKRGLDVATPSTRASKRTRLQLTASTEAAVRSVSGSFRQIQTDAMRNALESFASNKFGMDSKILNRVVAFEGNIGAGKSTLCGKFKKLYPSRCSLYKEMGNEKFLQLFYSNPAKYGFAYQWGMLKTRRFQLEMAQHDSKFGRIPAKQFYFWDRSMVGDYIFALWNHLLGSISNQEMEVYEDEFGGSMKDVTKISFLSDVHCYVLLNDEPKYCKFRVEEHRKNKSEEGIPLPYYEGIDDIHFDLFVQRIIPNKVAPTIVLTWGQYDNPQLLWNQLARIAGGAQDTVSVRHVTALPTVLADDEIVYSTEEQVREFYKAIQWDNAMAEKPAVSALAQQRMNKYSRAYFDSNIMRKTEEEKNVVADNSYGIKFYENEYKRVVLWHLSQFHEVCFY